jgi:hypothetical protein
VHAAGHPPGLLLTMHALALDTPGRLAAFCIVAGALSAPLTYALGRRVLDERGARVAGGLMALAPGALLFGATSADALYLTLGLLAAIPLLSSRPAVQLLGGAIRAVRWSRAGGASRDPRARSRRARPKLGSRYRGPTRPGRLAA